MSSPIGKNLTLSYYKKRRKCCALLTKGLIFKFYLLFADFCKTKKNLLKTLVCLSITVYSLISYRVCYGDLECDHNVNTSPVLHKSS